MRLLSINAIFLAVLVASATLLVGPSSVFAGSEKKTELNTGHKHDHEVELKHGQISTISIDAKVGDVVKIIYDDHDGIHKLYAKDGNYEFDLSNMKRGDHYDLKLKHAGKIIVRCHEMKHMTLEINVTAS